MPSGYLSRLSHAFIYKLNEFCAGRDLIRLSHFVFFFFFFALSADLISTFHSSSLQWPSKW